MISSTSTSRIRQIAAIFGTIAVIFGAFGAHALKAQLSISATLPANTFIRLSAWFFGLGIVCFSGSLYLLSLREILTINTAFVGPITPLGGLFFSIGWVFLFFSAFKKN